MDHITQPRPATHQHRILRGATQRLQKALRSRRRQKGFDLIQLGLVVALIGLMMGAALVGVPRLIENIKTGQQVEDIRSFATHAQAMFSNYRDSEISATAVAAAELYPTDKVAPFVPTEPKYLSRYTSGEVELGTAETRLITLALTPPSAGACSKITSQMAPIASAMQIGSAAKQTASGSPARVDLGKIAEFCQTAFESTKGADDVVVAPTPAGQLLTISIRV